MKITTKIRYAIRLLIFLAQRKGKVVFLKDVSEKENISFKYLEQIIPYLKNSGLILSKRGAKGGYILAKKPSQITIKEIVQSIEGPIAIVECVTSPEYCNRRNNCAPNKLWKKLNEQISDTLETITLEDLVSNKISMEVS
ncbi:MAG: Rrf2 family transcriptional regulator [Candidatus Marinimicrobia bacterium]|nr:Rrf2 family transcriptional regulator [Candidatus Neomarinimicrobiota bacterium]